MKKGILFTLLFLTVGLTVSAKNKSVRGDFYTSQDSITQSLVADSLQAIVDTAKVKTTMLTASTLLDEYGNAVDTSVVKLPNTYAWRIDPRFGDRILTPMDTVRENFHRSTLVEGKGLGVNFLGNVGGPMQQVEFFERPEASQFPFMDAYDTWRRGPEKQLFLNTKIPYSNVHYQAGGGKEVAENHFNVELSSNFGKRLNAGFNFDYIYSRGYYKSLYDKQISYDFNASYIGDKYKMHVFFGNNNLKTSDNGGIIDDRYITNPEAEDLMSYGGSSKDIPVMFEKGIRNHLRGRHFYLTNSYDLGNDKEYIMQTDTTGVWRKKENYIAPASVILTTHYQDQRRSLFSPGSVDINNDVELTRMDSLYVPNIVDQEGNLLVDEKTKLFAPKYTEPMDDYMSHYTMTTTLAFRMNEGFKSWTKFGLTAFIEHELRGFLYPDRYVRMMSYKEKENVFFVGGKLTKNQGRNFKFDVSGLKGINTGDLRLEGNVFLDFNLFGKPVFVKANAYLRKDAPHFFQENFSSRNYVFQKDLKDTDRFFVGGELHFPKLSFSETVVSGGYENITNHIYLSDQKYTEAVAKQKQDNYRRDIMQSSKTVNVLALKLKQKFKAGIFNLELEGLVQKSTEQDVIPLPLWTVYANVYLQTKISKVLTVQLGADAYIHEEYNAPRYDILLGQFYNQRTENPIKIGGFPHANAYVNLHLKYTRFFIMAYNIADGMGNKKAFASPHYPTNPFVIKWGLSWRFNN